MTVGIFTVYTKGENYVLGITRNNDNRLVYVKRRRLTMIEKITNQNQIARHKLAEKINEVVDVVNQLVLCEQARICYELIHKNETPDDAYTERNIDETTGRFLCSDPKLNEIKIRLYDKDRQCTKEYTLSKLIYIKFKRNKFEYRGMSTGLKDKNGNLIYEGDVVRCSDGNIYNICWSDSAMIMIAVNTTTRIGDAIYKLKCYDDLEIIGNVHEQAEQKDRK